MRLLIVCLALCCLQTQADAASKRLTIIVSDLHLEPGSRDAAFTHFLGQISSGSTTLVMNGDAFELRERTEAEALSKLEGIFEAHAALLDRLEVFASSNQIVFVPGDEDAALLFPGVAKRLRDRLGSVEVAPKGFWVSEDERVLVEHGHQLPWGSWVERVPDGLVIDGFAERLAGLKYALSSERGKPVPDDLLKLLLLNVSWQQFRRDLELDVEAPEWDLAAIRSTGDAFLLQSIPEDDPLYEAWRRTTLSASELTDDELRLVCDYRAAVRRARRRMERGLTQLARVGPVVAECPRLEHTRDPSFSYFWSSRDALYEKRLASFPSAPDVYVHGHTHLPDRGFVPGAQVDGPRILNSGAFKRVITPARFEAMKQERGVTTTELLKELGPEDLPPCYSYVVVEPYEETPDAQLTHWQLSPDGQWGVGRRCEM